MGRDDRFDDRGGDVWDDGLGLVGADDGDDYDDDWTEEDEARYQERRREEVKRSRRIRRQAISFLFLVLLVLGAGLGAAGLAQGWWEWPFGDDAPRSGTAPPTCAAPTLVAALPADTTVVVLNATDSRGLAGKVRDVLTQRGFKVSGIGNEERVEVLETAHIRYGPESVLQARAVAAHFPSPVLVDDGRAGTIVEVAVGEAFRSNTTPEVAAAAVAPVPAPSVVGCVPASTPAVTPTVSTPAATP